MHRGECLLEKGIVKANRTFDNAMYSLCQVACYVMKEFIPFSKFYGLCSLLVKLKTIMMKTLPNVDLHSWYKVSQSMHVALHFFNFTCHNCGCITCKNDFRLRVLRKVPTWKSGGLGSHVLARN